MRSEFVGDEILRTLRSIEGIFVWSTLETYYTGMVAFGNIPLVVEDSVLADSEPQNQTLAEGN